MSFCYSPWTNIDISPIGDITPCCKFDHKQYSEQFNIQTHTIEQYSQSQLVQEIKKEFLTGQWPKGCERCRIEEENSIESKRILDYNRWEEHYKEYDLEHGQFITASVAFGNTCNLKCITCNPIASSMWQQEYKKIFDVEVPHFKFYKQNFVNDFTSSVPNIVHLDVPGGEPFLSGVPEQKLLLQYYIDSGRSNKITLHYTTNVTVFPSQDWWNLWKHFKEIDIQLSIDGTQARYEYIRFPAKWKDIMINVEQYLQKENDTGNIRLSVSHTVSAYNILYLDEFCTWASEIGLPKPWLGRVQYPDHMRPGVWPNEAKNFIKNKILQSAIIEIHPWAHLMSNHDDSEHFDLFCQRLKEHDDFRGVEFATVFPELKNYIK
jgi:MoaA/NifB/PqqE/SkfB family radical SAM enzyme